MSVYLAETFVSAKVSVKVSGHAEENAGTQSNQGILNRLVSHYSAELETLQT